MHQNKASVLILNKISTADTRDSKKHQNKASVLILSQNNFFIIICLEDVDDTKFVKQIICIEIHN